MTLPVEAAFLMATFLLAMPGQARPLPTEPEARELLPDDADVQALTPASDAHVYGRGNLSEYCNGGAAKYLAYDLVALAVRRYVTDAGKPVTIEPYLMASAEDAYGLWSNDRRGEHPDVGAGARATYARGLLEACGGRLFLRVLCLDAGDRERQVVLDAARHIIRRLPDGERAAVEPPMVRRLPPDGLIPDTVVYFHTDDTLGHIYYLAEGNPLRLSSDTNGVLAEYEQDDHPAVAIVVEYPAPRRARAAFRRFRAAYLPERKLREGEARLITPVEDGQFCGTAFDGAYVFIVLDAHSGQAAEELLARLQAGYRDDEREKGAMQR